MIKCAITIICLASIVGGCVTQNKVEPTPENFIVRQNSSELSQQLNELKKQDYAVKFSRGKEALSDKEKVRLAKWIEKEQPSMIAVRGTGGAQKYSDLGEARKISTISQIITNQRKIEIIPLDYDAALPGGRAVIEIVSDELAQQIRDNAPILIIRPD